MSCICNETNSKKKFLVITISNEYPVRNLNNPNLFSKISIHAHNFRLVQTKYLQRQQQRKEKKYNLNDFIQNRKI